MKTGYHGEIQDGVFRLDPSEKERFKRDCQKKKDGRYEIILKRKYKGRSLEQNAYYWGVVLKIISLDTGHTPEELHDIFLHKFSGKETPLGRVVDVRTSEMDTSQMAGYITDIMRFASAELSIYIPEPGEM